MLLMDTTPKLFAPDEAERVAAVLNRTDDWEYRVRHDPKGTGYSFIEIWEGDEFVAYWTEG